MKLSEYFDKNCGIKIPNCKESMDKSLRLGFSPLHGEVYYKPFIGLWKDKKITQHGFHFQIEDNGYKELTLTEFMAIEEEDNSYEQDEIIKFMRKESFMDYPTGENPFVTTIKMLLKRIDENKFTVTPELVSEIVNKIKVVMDDSEKRCREYTDQLRNDIHKQILK